MNVGKIKKNKKPFIRIIYMAICVVEKKNVSESSFLGK